LTFRPLNWVTGLPCHDLPSCQFSACYALPVSTWVRRGQIHRRTDRRRPSMLNAPTLWGRGHSGLYCRRTSTRDGRVAKQFSGDSAFRLALSRPSSDRGQIVLAIILHATTDPCQISSRPVNVWVNDGLLSVYNMLCAWRHNMPPPPAS